MILTRIMYSRGAIVELPVSFILVCTCYCIVTVSTFHNTYNESCYMFKLRLHVAWGSKSHLVFCVH